MLWTLTRSLAHPSQDPGYFHRSRPTLTNYYSGHSFRVGAASAMFELKLPYYVIKKLGRQVEVGRRFIP